MPIPALFRVVPSAKGESIGQIRRETVARGNGTKMERRALMHELDVVPVVIACEGHRGSPSKMLLRAGRSHRFSSDSAY